jgi:hypothetical protein
MRELAATLPAAPASPAVADASGWARARSVVLLSLLVTIAAALFAIAPAGLLDVRWSVAFVVTRWLVVFALLALPLVHQVATRLGMAWSLPWGLRTPATGLLLTLEGIAWDIASAHL